MHNAEIRERHVQWCASLKTCALKNTHTHTRESLKTWALKTHTHTHTRESLKTWALKTWALV